MISNGIFINIFKIKVKILNATFINMFKWK